MKKSDFANNYNFKALEYATEVELTFVDGAIVTLSVDEYWPTGEQNADLLITHKDGQQTHYFLPSHQQFIRLV